MTPFVLFRYINSTAGKVQPNGDILSQQPAEERSKLSLTMKKWNLLQMPILTITAEMMDAGMHFSDPT